MLIYLALTALFRLFLSCVGCLGNIFKGLLRVEDSVLFPGLQRHRHFNFLVFAQDGECDGVAHLEAIDTGE